MRYYKVLCDHRKEVVGVYPQSEGMSPGYPYYSTDSVWNIAKDPKIKPNLNSIQIKNRSKMTDLLSVVVIPKGLIISEQFRKVLEKFNLPDHRYFSAGIKKNNRHNDNLKNYYLFLITDCANNYIRFEQSEFYVSLSENGVRNLEINSNKDLIATMKKPKTAHSLGVGESLKVKRLSIQESFDLDIFCFQRITSAYMISEKLKNAIESAALSGIRFEEVDYLCS